MLPMRHQKVDLSKLSEDELKAFKKYGKLPKNKPNLFRPQIQERKYFDSGDYVLNKVGKATGPVGVEHPVPENIPHVAGPNPAHPVERRGSALSPKMEGALLKTVANLDKKNDANDSPLPLDPAVAAAAVAAVAAATAPVNKGEVTADSS